MSIAVDRIRADPFPTDLNSSHRPRVLLNDPITKPFEEQSNSTMEQSSPRSSSAAPTQEGSDGDTVMETVTSNDEPGSATPATSPVNLGAAAAAAASAQQPKVVQTAFIHKLYNMLEDKSIQHLISWSATNDSFVMSPSPDFSKVLSQYFKHTNISSFVRQLNMYGFHKVSDVFHNGSPDSALWEFKHGNGNFKRGDLQGLREIKRRASRHTLTQREPVPTASRLSFGVNGMSIGSYDTPLDGIDRMTALEHHIYDISSRLHRTEEAFTTLHTKYQAMYEAVVKCQQWSNELVNCIDTVLPADDQNIRPSLHVMRQDIARQNELFRSFDQPQDPYSSRRATFFPSNMSIDAGQISPRQAPQDDPRNSSLGLRPSAVFAQHVPPVAPLAPSVLASAPRRYGSIGRPDGHVTPSRHNGPSLPLQSSVSQGINPASLSAYPPNRRHTTADVRADPAWQNHNNSDTSPLNPPSSATSVLSSQQWATSPLRIQTNADNQQIQSMLARYEIRPPGNDYQQITPPDGGPSSGGWGDGGRPSFVTSIHSAGTTGPPTRRTSVASNVHSLLNHPSEVPEMEGEEGAALSEDRKRKRLQ